jgi:hypothetical protein
LYCVELGKPDVGGRIILRWFLNRILTGVTSQKGTVVGFCKHYTELRFQMSNCKLLRITLPHGVGIISVSGVNCDFLQLCCYIFALKDITVTIATHYRLDGLRIESRWG